MKLIIDISDEEYKHIVNPSDQEKTLYRGRWFDIIRTGTPLSKERLQGMWIYDRHNSTDLDQTFVCSVCGRRIHTPVQNLIDYPFCHCGAELITYTRKDSDNTKEYTDNTGVKE